MGSAVEDTMTGMQCAWCVNGSVFHCNDCNREHCENHIWKCSQCGFDRVCVVSKETCHKCSKILCHKCSKILCHKCGNDARVRNRFVCDTCAA